MEPLPSGNMNPVDWPVDKKAVGHYLDWWLMWEGPSSLWVVPLWLMVLAITERQSQSWELASKWQPSSVSASAPHFRLSSSEMDCANWKCKWNKPNPVFSKLLLLTVFYHSKRNPKTTCTHSKCGLLDTMLFVLQAILELEILCLSVFMQGLTQPSYNLFFLLSSFLETVLPCSPSWIWTHNHLPPLLPVCWIKVHVSMSTGFVFLNTGCHVAQAIFEFGAAVLHWLFCV